MGLGGHGFPGLDYWWASYRIVVVRKKGAWKWTREAGSGCGRISGFWARGNRDWEWNFGVIEWVKDRGNWRKGRRGKRRNEGGAPLVGMG